MSEFHSTFFISSIMMVQRYSLFSILQNKGG